ncbi:hypothetical protein ZIOFF_039799 [Zingiber officinale]|uniref:Methyltransferase PMT26 n=1 Tax=Zingiber officinale TaxID=94328 RepID=A0A8J5G1U6_ZINOF|nr:hypothetical protein ZIOFF_039799 [Zingiber officinale]
MERVRSSDETRLRHSPSNPDFRWLHFLLVPLALLPLPLPRDQDIDFDRPGEKGVIFATMAFGKSSLMDSRRSSSSSSHWSMMTPVLFIALCLIGVWMMTSTTIVPVDESLGNKSEMKQQVPESDTKTYEDSSGDVPDEGGRRDADGNTEDATTELKSESSEEQSMIDKTDENSTGKVQNDDLGKDDEGKKDENPNQTSYNDEIGNAEGEETIKEGSQGTNGGDMNTVEAAQEITGSDLGSKSAQLTFSDENGKMEGGEMAKDNAEIKVNSQENGQEKSKEQSSQETTISDQEKTAALHSTNQDKSSENSSDDENNGDGETNDGEMINEPIETQESGQERDQEKRSEENYQGSRESNEETKIDQKLNEVSGNGRGTNSEQISDESKGDEQAGQYFNDKTDNAQNKSIEQNGEMFFDGKDQIQVTEKGKQKPNGTTSVQQNKDHLYDEMLLSNGAQSELLNESNSQNGAWSTQVAESKTEEQLQAGLKEHKNMYSWKLCNVTAGTDYIPCLDNEEVIKRLITTKHYEHRERHCPDDPPTCLVPLPEGYTQSIRWPHSRNKIWYYNVPHTSLATIKGHQNWVKVSGEFLTFPGGGTQFKHGALHYIDFIQESVPGIAWGKNSRVVLDVGCGVASFGGFLFDRDVLTMSFAPKDEHEAQVQFALERGIPAMSAVMGTKRLSFPGMVFDVIHCARCRVPWHIEGGKLLLELNRLLRPGGYFVWSATPVYQKLQGDVEIWEVVCVKLLPAISELTKSMCWDMLNKTKDKINRVGMVIYKKPLNNECYEKRPESNPPLCEDSDDPNAAWNIPLQACMHKLPVDRALRGSQWPQPWPQRLEKAPYWLNDSQVGVYGKPAPKDFMTDFEHWKYVVNNAYMKGMGIDWSIVRNVMDMRAIYGGFAAALQGEVNAWVMNVVSINSLDTLPIIYERGLFGIYHDWCESFSTYPRSYDLLHADHLFSRLKQRLLLVRSMNIMVSVSQLHMEWCKLLPVISEVDRILRPQGKLIVRDSAEVIGEVEDIAKSLNYEVKVTSLKDNEGFLCVQKTMWRPKEVEISSPSLA